ncbi:MAG: cell division protein FtsQ/DivIB [Bryobacteraceae bacterium]
MKEKPARGVRWRLWATLAFSGVGLAASAWAAKELRHFSATDKRFFLLPPDAETPGLGVAGVLYASPVRIERVFERDFGRSVARVPLAERRRQLLAVDWVADASVLRIWPNRIAVRIVERQPVAFVSLPARFERGPARLALIDDDGVILETPARSRFSFPVLRGLSEKEPETERARQVRLMQRIRRDVEPFGKTISEIDVGNPDNPLVTVELEGRAVTLALGDRNFRTRFQNFLSHYPEIRKRLPEAGSFDLRLDDRITAKE